MAQIPFAHTTEVYQLSTTPQEVASSGTYILGFTIANGGADVTVSGVGLLGQTVEDIFAVDVDASIRHHSNSIPWRADNGLQVFTTASINPVFFTIHKDLGK